MSTIKMAQIVISDPDNAITFVERRRRGGLYLQQGRNHVNLNSDELARFIDAAREIERENSGVVYSTTTTPAKSARTTNALSDHATRRTAGGIGQFSLMYIFICICALHNVHVATSAQHHTCRSRHNSGPKSGAERFFG
jgi:hypothetical protein